MEKTIVEERCNKYKEYFTKEYMMGPNSLRLLEEIIADTPEAIQGGRVLDLGCGEALTSIFVAKETAADTVYATDLWISATDNYKRIQKEQLEEKIIPIHADAMELPFAEEYFDAIVSIDAYHYFGTEEPVFAEKILPLMKKGGYALICIPGLNKNLDEENEKLMYEWAQEEMNAFKTVDWWETHIKKLCEDQIEIKCYESSIFDQVWDDWIQTGHEYALRDAEYLKNGLDKLLNFVMIVVKKKR